LKNMKIARSFCKLSMLLLAVQLVFGQNPDKRQLEEAVGRYEASLKQDPGNVEVKSQLVRVLRALAAEAIINDPEKALSHLIRAKALAPADAEILFEFAMAALRLTLHEDAAPALVEALTYSPDEPRFLYALARARMGMGDLNEAERLFRRYTELRPDDATGQYGLGYVLAGLRRNKPARLAFERSLALRPDQSESDYQIGLLDLAEGNLDAAEARFTKVLARYRTHTGAQLGLGRVYFNRKEYEAARKSLEHVLELDPAQQQAHYYLSLTFARLGNKEAATREAEISDSLEREQKNLRRTILKLYAPAEDARPATERKP